MNCLSENANGHIIEDTYRSWEQGHDTKEEYIQYREPGTVEILSEKINTKNKPD